MKSGDMFFFKDVFSDLFCAVITQVCFYTIRLKIHAVLYF